MIFLSGFLNGKLFGRSLLANLVLEYLGMNLPRLFLVIFLSIIIGLIVNQFFFCPFYQFASSKPFEGQSIYNPYDNVQAEWLKCNFHAHAKAWQGITNGHGTASDIHTTYDSLNYAIHCVSNYHQIDTSIADAKNYIPAYEHGYNLLKTHQLVLGAKEVKWVDYLLPQTLSNKQEVLNSLSLDTNAVVILNHPKMRNGYKAGDLAYLTNYHCMEVLNPAAESIDEWDAALSAGKPVFIVGNDDLHDITRKEQAGRICTYVNAPEINREQVCKALKKGQSYGVKVGDLKGKKLAPLLKTLKVNHDSIYLEMNEPAQLITFTGQGGQILASFDKSSSATYAIKPEDHYARATVVYENGTEVYLNPVFYTDAVELHQASATNDIFKTVLFRTLGLLILAFWFRWAYFYVLLRKRRTSFPQAF